MNNETEIQSCGVATSTTTTSAAADATSTTMSTTNERKTEYFDIDEDLPKKPKRSLKVTFSSTKSNSNSAQVSPSRSPLTELKERLKQQWRKKKEDEQRWFDETGGLSDDESFRERIQLLREESASLATVRKDRVFDSEITEEEEKIIQRRVELQRLQLQEYERREKARVIARIRFNFPYLTKDEIKAGLEESNDSEESILLNITHPEFLMKVRKKLAIQYEQSGKCSKLTAEQRAAYKRLLQRRKQSVKKTTTEEVKIRCIKYSRLKLDEALEKLDRGEDPAKVFEGWSEARIKAYKQIHTKPNVYYYRFNAPGEKQENGPWRPEEKALFFKRIEEVGANGQWGIFSMAIPGRVGYQCSNYYRHLLKTGEIQDPNYTRDEKGELHYLFGKKEGKEGVIRTHRKHGTAGTGTHHKKKKKEQEDIEAAARAFAATKAGEVPLSATVSSSSSSSSTNLIQVSSIAAGRVDSSTTDPVSPSEQQENSLSLIKTSSNMSNVSESTLQSAATGIHINNSSLVTESAIPSESTVKQDLVNSSVSPPPMEHQDSNSTQANRDEETSSCLLESTPTPQESQSAATKKRRKKKDDQTMSTSASDTSKPNAVGKPSKRRKKDEPLPIPIPDPILVPPPPRPPTPVFEDDDEDDFVDEDDSGDFASSRKKKSRSSRNATTNRTTTQTSRRKGKGKKNVDDDDADFGGDSCRISFSKIPDINPLPGFTDPITLEEVIKPAISKYGHVMGYNSWLRCLNGEDRKNICPITKKPLTKRELVVLTPENIGQYYDKIVNK